MSNIRANNKQKKKKVIILSVLLGIIGAGAIIGGVTWFYTKKNNNLTTKSDISTPNSSSSSSSNPNSNSGSNSNILDNGQVTLKSSGDNVNQTLNFGQYSSDYQYLSNQDSYIHQMGPSPFIYGNAKFKYNLSSLDTITANVDINIPNAKYNWYLISAPSNSTSSLENLTYDKAVDGYLICSDSQSLSYTQNNTFQSLLETLSGMITLKCVVSSSNTDATYTSEKFTIAGYCDLIDTQSLELSNELDNNDNIVLFKTTNNKEPVFSPTYNNASFVKNFINDLTSNGYSSQEISNLDVYTTLNFIQSGIKYGQSIGILNIPANESYIYNQIANLNSSLQTINDIKSDNPSYVFNSNLFNILVNKTNNHFENYDNWGTPDKTYYKNVWCAPMLNIVNPKTNQIILQIPEANWYILVAYNETIQDYLSSTILSINSGVTGANAQFVTTYDNNKLSFWIYNMSYLFGVTTYAIENGSINIMHGDQILTTITGNSEFYPSNVIYQTSVNALNISGETSYSLNFDITLPEPYCLFYGNYTTGTNTFNVTITPPAWTNITYSSATTSTYIIPNDAERLVII